MPNANGHIIKARKFHLPRLPREVEPELESPPPVRIAAVPKKKHPSSIEDDRLIAVIVDAFSQLSWDGCVRTFKVVSDLYTKWQREGRYCPFKEAYHCLLEGTGSGLTMKRNIAT